MFKSIFTIFFLVTLFILLSTACNKSTGSSVASSNTALPAVFKKFDSTLVTIYVDGDYIVLKSNGLPNHKSPYYKGTQWASTLYEAYNGTNANWNQNPNTITTQNLVFKIPLNPSKSASVNETPMGPMGIATNGVCIFNQYAAGRVALTDEINSFDQYNGHPQQSGQYHYHVEPLFLTSRSGRDALIGFLLDGFPVYGPVENGKTLTDADLDAYHGHTTITADYPNGIYHYHITSDAPYINGTGFYGSPGSVTD